MSNYIPPEKLESNLRSAIVLVVADGNTFVQKVVKINAEKPIPKIKV